MAGLVKVSERKGSHVSAGPQANSTMISVEIYIFSNISVLFSFFGKCLLL